MKPGIAYLKMLRLSTMNEERYLALYQGASEQRRDTADRLARREDALRCVAADALLRSVMAECGIAPDTPILIGEKGKPSLDLPDFHYNISHGGDYVVIAYGKTEIGVDIEPIIENDRRIALAKRFFTPWEQDFLACSDTAEAATRFTILWTRKESYVKYTGVGLSQGLQSFSVDVALPQGSIVDARGERLPLCCHSFLTEDQHVISLCGSFHQLETEYVSL